ncbi:hypothetical protein QVH35_08370 [Candidatus Nitrosotenuis chungbukensis]|uniref:hypothetical protein n=1 Tax=Candidatus Nitrosotenuis chungbukensis TaxID=1353246 RepID=UPI0026713D5D|nr:hypothetical protein [Candidatus Nitrosotenuis chungbukensis]WKT57405.1 hypothetical protein QVH35_08370 [Candidatus Nitrosotenuis chungbukensis]
MDDSQVISSLVDQQNKLRFTMSVGGANYPVESLDIAHMQTPVTKPTMRGGVYFSNLKEYKIRAKFSDAALSSVLSKTMLGPNTDFERIEFLTGVESGGTKKQATLFANLTNYVQRGGGLELNLVVVGAELSD